MQIDSRHQEPLSAFDFLAGAGTLFVVLGLTLAFFF